MPKIPKKIFFIWFGNNIPKYVYFCIENFKKINYDFQIFFIHKTIEDIENIYFNKNKDTIFDNILFDTISMLINDNNNIYSAYIKNQKQLYSKNIRFIQILSDIYRVYLTNIVGGIYLDCDTFPLRKFDECILNTDFCVAKYFSKNIASVDNYFFGFTKKQHICEHIIPIPTSNLKILQLLQVEKNDNKLNNEIYRQKFFNCILHRDDIITNKDFYIKHFCKNSWNKNNVINIPFCKLDRLLK